MGWQSYFLTYTCKEELEKIFLAINQYQKIWFGDSESTEEIGEEIMAICFCRVIKPKKIKHKYVLMFGIGGGRSYCEEFFQRRDLELNYFDESVLKSVEKEDSWFKYDSSYGCNGGFNYLNKKFISKLETKGYVNIFSIGEHRNAIKFIKNDKTYWNPDIKNLPDQKIADIITKINQK